jgi:hypothetical protein
MATPFRTMSEGQRALLLSLDTSMTYKDLCTKVAETFTRGRVMGLLNSLMYRGLVDNKHGIWFRTPAGERVANK